MNTPSLKNQVKSVRTIVANTDLRHSVRIGISYFGSKTKDSSRSLQKLYVRVGHMVVSTTLSREVKLLPTLRATLIAIALYPKYLTHLPSSQSRIILSAWELRFLKIHQKKLMRLPILVLLELAASSMISLQTLSCGGHLRTPTFLSVKDMLRNLHLSVITLICYLTKYDDSYAKNLRTRLPNVCVKQ